MKVKGIDGRDYKLNWGKNAFLSRNSSAPHKAALLLLSEMFPGFGVYEEITLPGTKPALYADLFLPHIPMIVEAHGPQHYEYIQFFHKTKAKFLLAKAADRQKEAWANLNNIVFVALPHDKEESWRTLINSAISRT